ncbi:hypothetical protein LBMAG56_10970 [Verrucomicrobiota bacterium]|nr:hypothetical protein LBMAG56_10970 [Verrucomicrobiota bacterium]
MKTLRRTLLVLASLITLIALFYAVEGLRGMRVWRKTKADLEAKGERFDWKSLAPPAVPDAENFAMTPLLAPLLDFVSDPKAKPGMAQSKPRNQAAHDRLTQLKFTGNNPPSQGGWRLCQPVDLAAWQAHFRAFTNFPTAPVAAQPGEDILLALAQFDPEMNELRAAARRPHSQFHVRYEDNFAALLPHLSVLRKFSQIAVLQASARLSLGQTDAALDDLRLTFRLADAISAEPVLISGLVQLAILEHALQPVWEGLARRQWSDAQLQTLEKQLAATDMLVAYQRAIRGEQAFAVNTIDFVRDNPRTAGALIGIGDPSPNTVAVMLVPSGWLEQNKAYIVSLHQQFTLPVIDPEKRLFRFDVYQRAKENEPKLRTTHPYRILAGMLFPAVLNIAEKFAFTQSALDLARIACALERHRLKHGAFPESTAALVPDFLPRLPHDLMSGTALKYRRTADGKFILYSVGLNETDDGGEVVTGPGTPPRADPKRGDWVWSYDEKPAKP